MPPQVTQIGMAAPSRMVNYRYFMAHNHAIAPQRKPCTQVDIFVIEKEPRIESTNFTKNAARKQHEHPAHPIRKDSLILQYIVAALAFAKYLAKYFKRRRKVTGAIFHRTALSNNNRGRHTNRRILQARKQCRERIFIKPDVWIHHTKKPPRYQRKCLIVVCGESLRLGIANNPYRKRKTVRSERQRLFQVKREDQLDRHCTAIIIDIMQQACYQINLSMADNRNGNFCRALCSYISHRKYSQ